MVNTVKYRTEADAPEPKAKAARMSEAQAVDDEDEIAA